MKIEKYKIFHLAIDEENKKCEIILGNNLIDTLPNKDKAISKIDKKPWDYIFKLIVIVVNNIIKQNEEKKQQN